jgi:hypothetical protein
MSTFKSISRLAVMLVCIPMAVGATSKPKICFENALTGNSQIRDADFRVVLPGRLDEHGRKLEAGKSDCVTWGVFDEGCIPGKEYEVKVDLDIKMRKDKTRSVTDVRCGDTVVLHRSHGRYALRIDRGQPCFQDEEKGCREGTAASRQYILLAHGMNDQLQVWNAYVRHLEEKYPKVKVLRTSVARCGTIEERAEQLADYVVKMSQELGIPDAAIKAVGHSMGGIDLRHIVGKAESSTKFRNAAKKFRRVYTLGTPHHGARGAEALALLKGCPDASLDVSERGMEAFNKRFKFEDFKERDRSIPFLAFNFQCRECLGEGTGAAGSALPLGDCVVSANSQTWRPAPLYCSGPIEGRHSVGGKGKSCQAELANTSVLDIILRDPVCD